MTPTHAPTTPRIGPANGRSQNEEIVCVEGISKRFGGHVVLNEVSFGLREGEVLLLTGENGSGKSTLLGVLSGLIAPDAGRLRVQLPLVTETFDFPLAWRQRQQFQIDEFARRGIFCRTWQDVRLFPNHSAVENIALGAPKQVGESLLGTRTQPFLARRQDAELRREAAETLRTLGIDEKFNSPGATMSTGESQRVGIARAVRAGAKVLLLDEPFAGLDEAAASSIVTLLRELAQIRRIALVIVEHRIDAVGLADLVDFVGTLDRGTLKVEKASVVFARRKPETSPAAWLAQFAPTGTRIVTRDLSGGAMLVATESRSGAPIVLDVRNLVLERGRRTVMGQCGHPGPEVGLTFSLTRGQRAAILAPNGWGKSTLFLALAGILPIFSGVVAAFGQIVERADMTTARWSTTARARLGLSLLRARTRGFPNLVVDEVLRLAGATPSPQLCQLSCRRVATLSGGERQLLALACVLGAAASHHRLFLLDEPLSALDAEASTRLTNEIRERVDDTLLFAIPCSTP